MQRRSFFTLAASSAFAQVGKIRLIVQGDDMGAARAINQGTILAFREGVMRSTNVIVPGPWFLDAVRELSENPALDAGIHLALTSEWDRVKWRPLTHAPSLVDKNGYLPAMIRGTATPDRAVLTRMPFKLEEIEAELRAQIETAKKHIPRVSYMSGHMGCTNMTPEVSAITARLSKEFGIPVPGAATGIQRFNAGWKREMNADERASAFAARMEELKPGTYVFVEHAAVDNPESRAIGHPGYEDVAKDRQAVLDAWRHTKVRDAVKRLGIELIGHNVK